MGNKKHCSNHSEPLLNLQKYNQMIKLSQKLYLILKEGLKF
jgi:hypothetical protein